MGGVGDGLLVDLLVRHLSVRHDHQNVVGVLVAADVHGFLDERHEVGRTGHRDGRRLLVVDAKHLYKRRFGAFIKKRRSVDPLIK